MKKILSLVLVLVLSFGMGTSSFAGTNTLDELKGTEKKSEELKNEYSKYEKKLIEHQKLVKSGVNASIDKEIQDYYEKNEKSIITSSDFLDLSYEEMEGLANEIESSMLSSNAESTKGHGLNVMSWDAFENGDIVLVHDGFCPYGYFRHCGTYSEELECCITAQMKDVGNGKGVIYESKSWYNRNYDVAAGYSPRNCNSTMRANVEDFLDDQLGEPYSLTSGYYNWEKWSCVKLPWVGWYEKADINIAVDVFTLKPLRKFDGICLPDSIEKSPNTYRFAYGS